ncbi:MAG: hypothetical protein DRO88_04585 [Promethearchaeia archaeon]|nr:MAG: hypothetical protein DRO88_04585 [Candidatus Lokiarchaeia archaeon]
MDKFGIPSLEKNSSQNNQLSKINSTSSLPLQAIQNWFDEYYNQFLNLPSLNTDDLDAIQLKYDHSYRVMKEMDVIVNSLKDTYNLTSSDIDQAKIIGLLHDVARFFQYTKYHTMNDSISEDHGDLGVKILRDTPLIQNLPENIQKEIFSAVAAHNKIKIPPNLNPRELLFTQMIRDADKLDVFHLACPIYRDFPDQLGEKLKLHLPSRGDPNTAIINAFFNHTPISFSEIRNMTDFKILQMAWVFDFNFRISVEMCHQRGYLATIFNSLPVFSQKKDLWEDITSYIETKLHSR